MGSLDEGAWMLTSHARSLTIARLYVIVMATCWRLVAPSLFASFPATDRFRPGIVLFVASAVG